MSLSIGITAPYSDATITSGPLMRDFVAHQKKKDKGRPLPPTVAAFAELQECWRRLRGQRLQG